MGKVKTVVIINDFDYTNGGAAKVALNTAELLSKRGIEVYFFSATNKHIETDSKIKYISTNQEESLKDRNKLRGSINGIYNRKAKKELEKLLDILDPNTTVIHVHGWMKALSSSVFSAITKKKFKFVVTFHDYFSMCPNGGFFNYKKNEICKLKPLSWKCIKCNCDSRNYLFKIYRVIRQFVQNKLVKINKKIKYVISISNFSYNILKDSLSEEVIVRKIENPIEIDLQSKRIHAEKNNNYLYVGRVSKEKGVNIFCEAITKLNLQGVVVGDGNQRDILKKKYPNISFVGWKSKEDVIKYMKESRILVFPSKWYEGAPLTTLEANSIGLPCISSNCCAAIENINNEKNGLVFDIDNQKDLIEKLEKTFNDKTIKNMSDNCYNTFWSKNNKKKKYEEEVLDFFNTVIKG